MFTGLVADKGQVLEIKMNSESALFRIESNLTAEIKVGDSISVNGVCLTAISLGEQFFEADVMIQTLRITSLKSLEVGSSVNLELATRADSRLGGPYRPRPCRWRWGCEREFTWREVEQVSALDSRGAN